MSLVATIAQAERDRASRAASTAGRAAQRAITRYDGVTDEHEVDLLYAQIKALDDESDEDSAKEYAIIQARFSRLAAEHNAKAAETSNDELEFACAICFENRGMVALRILAPCGHGFCFHCTDAHIAAAGAPAATCPNCRAPITSVITARF